MSKYNVTNMNAKQKHNTNTYKFRKQPLLIYHILKGFNRVNLQVYD